MWTDKALESLIDELRTFVGERKATKYLTYGPFGRDQLVDQATWNSWPLGVRAYYCVFHFGVHRATLDMLYLICPRAQAEQIYRQLTDDRGSRVRELTREASWKIAVSRMLSAHSRQQEKKTNNPQQRGWTREDVVAEFYDETGEPRLGPPKKTPDPIMPEYDQPPSPVRKVSVEEYLRTKRNPLYGGVKPEFAKESEHFAKEIPDSADKIYDGTPLDEIIGQTT